MNYFINFSKYENRNSKFSAQLANQGGHVVFSNSGQRGSKKFFTLGLESFLQILKDIKKNLSRFQKHNSYVEKEWRDLGSEFFTDPPANAQSTVQTKPLFATLSKIIMWANSPALDEIDPENEISLSSVHLDTAIKNLEILIRKFTPEYSDITESDNEIILEENKIRDFAISVFKYFYKNHWSNLIENSDPNSAKMNGASFISYDLQSFKRLIAKFSQKQTKEELTTSSTQRYFEEPIYEQDGDYYYFSTQWVGNGDGSLSFNSLKKHFEVNFEQFELIKDADGGSYQLRVKSDKSNLEKESFIKSLKDSGLNFSSVLVTRFIASLVTKPFVLLTGLTGSGKTKLAHSFVHWISRYTNQYCIVPVGADWTNREPLLGYPNALNNEEYIKPENGVLDLLLRADKFQNEPHFLILDEMNLSHVERYFADFLSIMETKSTITLFSDEKNKDGIPSIISWPANLFIIGTVNIDETTYMFSPKVLDRANTIEFRVKEDEMENFLNNHSIPDLSKLESKGVSMASNFLQMSNEKSFDKKESVNEVLLQFFNELKKTGTEFGYRSASEIYILLGQLKKVDQTLNENALLDIAIMQKMLPKLHGSRRKLCPTLVNLGKLCLKTNDLKIEKDVFENDNFPFDDSEQVKFPISLEKISRMYNGAVDNGFASYAEA